MRSVSCSVLLSRNYSRFHACQQLIAYSPTFQGLRINFGIDLKLCNLTYPVNKYCDNNGSVGRRQVPMDADDMEDARRSMLISEYRYSGNMEPGPHVGPREKRYPGRWIDSDFCLRHNNKSRSKKTGWRESDTTITKVNTLAKIN